MLKLFVHIVLGCFFCISPCIAQTYLPVHNQSEGSITFAVDEVQKEAGQKRFLKWEIDGKMIPYLFIENSHVWGHRDDYLVDMEEHIHVLANSFEKESNLIVAGGDTLYKMVIDAWLDQWNIVLSPDVLWLVILQQFNYYLSKHDGDFGELSTEKEKKNMLEIISQDSYSSQSDWESVIFHLLEELPLSASAKLIQNTFDGCSTSHAIENTALNAALHSFPITGSHDFFLLPTDCGIPSITLTGTPDDWRMLLRKAQVLRNFKMDGWVSELEPILKEFIHSSEGYPDPWFWRGMVNASISGKSFDYSYERDKKSVPYDGWFLKFFLYDKYGRERSGEAFPGSSMFPEISVIPFVYRHVDGRGKVISEIPMELATGIMAIKENLETSTLMPLIGWYLNTIPEEVSLYNLDSDVLICY